MGFTKISRNTYILLAIFFGGFTASHAQFILPEDKFTTQKDMDVIRVKDPDIDINNLKIKINKAAKGEVLLSWNNLRTKTELAVVRHEKPISNLSLLKMGKVITVLSNDETYFKDTIALAGDYYYAVVSYQRLKDDNVILKPNENFSTSVIHFEEKDLASRTRLVNETVTGIKVEILDNKTVRVQWAFEPAPNTSLLVYRASSEISDEARLKSSTRVGTVPSEKNYFDDQDAVTGDLYYAVTVFTQFEIEKYQFKANQNYTTLPIKKPEIPSSVVRSLRATGNANSQIVLNWYDPSPQYTSEYIIYRSDRQILHEADLQSATILDRVGSNIFTYLDQNIPETQLYYAVLTQNKQGSIQRTLLPGENTLINFAVKKKVEAPVENTVVAPVNPEQGTFYDMQATNEKNMVRIFWKPDKKQLEALPVKGVYYHLFRFTSKPESMKDLSTDNYIAKIEMNEDSYFDSPEKDGLYYYAIFLTTPKGVLPAELKFGDNLVGPVIYKKIEVIDKQVKTQDLRRQDNIEVDFSIFDNTSILGEEKINSILRSTYLQENYRETLDLLKEYRHHQNRKIRARAIFYSALSNYYLGNYREAMDMIMDNSVKSVYTERADFWYRQILEKITK